MIFSEFFVYKHQKNALFLYFCFRKITNSPLTDENFADSCILLPQMCPIDLRFMLQLLHYPEQGFTPSFDEH